MVNSNKSLHMLAIMTMVAILASLATDVAGSRALASPNIRPYCQTIITTTSLWNGINEIVGAQYLTEVNAHTFANDKIEALGELADLKNSFLAAQKGLASPDQRDVALALRSSFTAMVSLQRAVTLARNPEQLLHAVNSIGGSSGEVVRSPIEIGLLKSCVAGLTRPKGALSNASFRNARAQWEGEGFVGGGAAQNIPFILAAADLERVAARRGSAVAYSAATAALDDAIGPITDVTTADAELTTIAIGSLRRFFDAGFVNDTEAATYGPYFRLALNEWEREPQQIDRFTRAPLVRALKALQNGARKNPGDQAYGAAVLDLESLVEAKPAGVIMDADGAYRERIMYLNVVFEVAAGASYNFRNVLET